MLDDGDLVLEFADVNLEFLLEHRNFSLEFTSKCVRNCMLVVVAARHLWLVDVIDAYRRLLRYCLLFATACRLLFLSIVYWLFAVCAFACLLLVYCLFVCLSVV